MIILKAKNLKKSYGKTEVLHGIDLEIKNGDFVVFVGPSGCGKSTLLRMIAGLEDITGGELWLENRLVNDEPPTQRKLAMVFQSYALYPHMSVRQNLAFGLENLRMPKAEVAAKVLKAAQMLHIEPFLNRKPGALSGGQKQRVAIGRAIVREPKIFLFDEPLSNLDAELRVRMRAEICNLHHEIGNTMIYVTHDQTEAMTMADSIVVLKDGKIEQHGKPLDLYNNPANMFVAGFIGSPKMNFLTIEKAQPTGKKLDLELKQNLAIQLDFEVNPQNLPTTLGIRPEHIQLANGQTENIMPAQLTMVEQLGAVSFLYCKTPTAEQITVEISGQVNLKKNDQVKLYFPKEHCYLFGADMCNLAL